MSKGVTTMGDDVPRGCECDCGGELSQCGGVSAPVAFEVTRDGERIKVCTRCELPSDTDEKVLVDLHTPVEPYIEYDALGALAVSGELGKKVFQQ